MKQTSIRYRFARGLDGAIIDILTLDPNNRKQNLPLTCFGCGGILIPHLGLNIAWHYAHKRCHICAPETQLHKLAKEVFTSTYRGCLQKGRPFTLIFEAEVLCTGSSGLEGHECIQKEKRSINLTDYFDIVSIEAPVGNVTADVLLSSSKNKNCLLIEFAVTHESGPEKIATGYRIVEIKLGQESDIEILKQPYFDTCAENTTTYNFHTSRKTSNVCRGQCPNQVGLFLVYRSGKAILLRMSAAEAAHYVPKGQIVYKRLLSEVIDVDLALSWNFQEEVFRAYSKGAQIKNCFLCKYQGTSMERGKIFCKTYRKDAPSNSAVECDRYRTRLNRSEARKVQKELDEEEKKNWGDRE